MTSILSTDLVSTGPAVINANFAQVPTTSTLSGSYSTSSTISGSFVAKPIIASVLGSGVADNTTFLRGDLTWNSASAGEWTYQSTIGLIPSSVTSFAALPSHDFYKIRFDNISSTTNLNVVPQLNMQVNNIGASVYSRAYVNNGATYGADGSNGQWGIWSPNTAIGSVYGFTGEYTLKGKPTNSIITIFGNASGGTITNEFYLLRGATTSASVISTVTFIQAGAPHTGTVELWYKDNQ